MIDDDWWWAHCLPICIAGWIVLYNSEWLWLKVVAGPKQLMTVHDGSGFIVTND